MKLPRFLQHPPHTLLYITEAKTFRFDTDRKGVIKGDLSVLDIDCEKPGRLPAALERIIAQSPPLGRKVWLLYARLDTHTLSLPSLQVEGIEQEFLEQALQFEYEAMTGKTAGKSRLAHQFLGADEDMSHFWIHLIAQETLTGIAAVLKKAGSSLGGLAHPGGLPVLLSGGNEASWLRIECWSSSVFTLAKSPDQGLTLQILHKEQHPQWQDEIAHWLLEIGPVDKTESVLNNQIEYIPATETSYRLSPDQSLIFWAGLWAQHLLDSGSPMVPLLSPKTPVNRELMYMAGSGTAAALLCASHFTWLLYQTHHYDYETEQLRQAEKDIKSYRDSVNKNQDEIAKLAQQITTVASHAETIPKALAGFKTRPAVLLQKLSEGSPEDLVIEDIQTAERQLQISGVSLQAHLPNALANRLEAPLQALGWRVSPPTKKDLGLFESGGPWHFAIVIDDTGLQGFSETTAQVAP
ncbi:MAG: hypothetical protein IBX56_00970 [Methylomicrobium sp.]|nr:hypothetical protein [Methylomicrobium sp.]